MTKSRSEAQLDSLAEEFNKDTTLFIGSGASVDAGLPSWWELVSWLKDYASKLEINVAAANAFLNNNNCIYAASAITLELERLGGSLADFFNDCERCSIFCEAEPLELHHLIAQLPTSSVITTNYDRLLEKAYAAVGHNIQVVHKGEIDLLTNIKRNKLKDYLYKYHGCITRPEQIVLDFNQYNLEKHGESIDAECLKNLMQSKTFLFIGTGLEDPDFKNIFDYLIHINKSDSINSWAFMRNCEDQVDFYKKQFGVNVINYAGEDKDHSDLLNKLQELIKKIRDIDRSNLEGIELAVHLTEEPAAQVGALRKILVQVNEEIIPLDKQILGFVSFFDRVEKNQCIKYLTEFKGNVLDDVLIRIEFLINRQLMKKTEHYFLQVREAFSVEAAELVEDDIIEFLMECENE